MKQYLVSPQATVRLNASGNGQIGLTPPSGCRWDLTLAAVSTTGTVLLPKAFLYLGNSNGPLTLIDSTYAGNSASSGKVRGTPFYAGTYVWAIWQGADANSIAVLQLYGQQSTRYRAGLAR
jgi:hypothetical protein